VAGHRPVGVVLRVGYEVGDIEEVRNLKLEASDF